MVRSSLALLLHYKLPQTRSGGQTHRQNRDWQRREHTEERRRGRKATETEKALKRKAAEIGGVSHHQLATTMQKREVAQNNKHSMEDLVGQSGHHAAFSPACKETGATKRDGVGRGGELGEWQEEL